MFSLVGVSMLPAPSVAQKRCILICMYRPGPMSSVGRLSSCVSYHNPPSTMLQEPEHPVQSIIDQPTLKPSDQTLTALFCGISSPTHPVRAKAFTALALIFQHHPPEACDFLRAVLEDSFLHSTHCRQVCDGLKVLSAVLLLSPPHALRFIRSNGFLSRLAGSVVDLLSLDGPSSKKLSKDVDLNHSFSEFIALALNHKSVREIIQTDWSGCVTWLTQISTSTVSTISIPARCAASLALIKLRLTSDLDQNTLDLPSLTGLIRVVLDGFLTNDPLCISTSVEALALVSHKPSAREILMSKSEPFLHLIKTQLALSSHNNQENLTANGTVQSDTAIEYGIATILANLSSYNIIKTDEDQAADQLKKLAKRSRAQQGVSATRSKISEGLEEEQDEKEIDDEVVFGWIQGTLKRNNDLMDILGWLVKSESQQVRRTTGKLILNLVDRQQVRGIILQCGGARMLMKIIATLTVSDQYKARPESSHSSANTATTTFKGGDGSSSTSNPTLDPSDLHIIQALAKLLITTNPLLIFGPSNESLILLSTIKPLTTLFVHPSSTLLQTFEALMALTNLSSLGGKIPSLIAESDRVFSRLEECMIGVRTAENSLICRASTELICNLSSTRAVLDHFSLQKNSSISRLHLLIALSSSDDLPTALAASGSLAILTENSPKVAQIISNESQLIQSLSRVIIDLLEQPLDEKPSSFGLHFRLISLLVHLSPAFTSSFTSNLLTFSQKLNAVHRLRCAEMDPEFSDLIQFIDSLVQSLQK